MSTCENPCYPNWPWRYSRNKHLTRFEPWYTRVEQWPPHYRKSGVPDNFGYTFTDEVALCDRTKPIQQTRHLNSCRDMGSVGFPMAQREAGFGTAALGLTPGPPPPTLGPEQDNFMGCPVFYRSLDPSSQFLPRICPGDKYTVSFDPMKLWGARHKMHLKGHAMEKRLPVLGQRARDRCSSKFGYIPFVNPAN